MAGSLLPQPKQIAFDSAFNPGIAYQFYTYDVGTLTPKATYQDAALTIANTNPVIANGRGEVVMYGSGAYRLILKDALGSTIWDRDNVESPSSGVSSLSASLAAAGGSALVGFQQLASSTVRTVQAKLRDMVSVKDFGATGDGATDDTAAIQAALNAVTSGILFFPKGTYRLTSVTAPNPIVIRGDGKYSTVLRTTSATADAIICTAGPAYEFSDMTIGSTVTRTAGSYIKFAPTTGYNNDSTLKRLNISEAWIGINFISGAGFAVEDCYFGGYIYAGIQIANAATPDAGDSYLSGNTFDGSGHSGASVIQSSAGGVKAVGNKFLAGAYHYLLQVNTGVVSTSILVFEGNSTENASLANIALSSQANTPFGRAIISGNQVSIAPSATGVLVSDPGYVWLDGLSIGGNQFAYDSNSIGLNIASGSRVSIGTNTYLGNGPSTGVTIGTGVASAVIGFQDFQAITTEWNGTFANVTFNPRRVESGVATGTTSNAYGPLYSSPSATVTFAKAFPKAPSVSATTALAAGGGASVIIDTPTTTGFAYQIIGVNSAGAVSMRWVAHG